VALNKINHQEASMPRKPCFIIPDVLLQSYLIKAQINSMREPDLSNDLSRLLTICLKN
jgi:hypothetical protein